VCCYAKVLLTKSFQFLPLVLVLIAGPDFNNLETYFEKNCCFQANLPGKYKNKEGILDRAVGIPSNLTRRAALWVPSRNFLKP